MSSIYIPSFSEISAVAQSRGADSRAPGLWRGLVGAWPLQEVGGDKAFDVSGYHNHGTLTNMDPATDRMVGSVGRFVRLTIASYKYINVSAACITATPLTLSCWAQAQNVTANHTLLGIFKPGGVDDSHTNGFYLSLAGEEAGDYAMAITMAANSWAIANSSGSFLAARWYHITGVFSSAVLRTCYLNGVAGIANTASKTPTGLSATYMGRYQAWNSSIYSDCDITNARIWNRVLLPSEIRSLYTNPWGMYTLRRRVHVRGAEVGTTIRWPWQLRRHRRMAGAR